MEDQLFSVKAELKSMDQRLHDLEEKMTSIDTKLTQVVDAILGNPLTKAGGFITDIEVLKKKIDVLEATVEKQEEFKKKVYWAGAIIVFIVLAISYVTSIYSNVTN
jgi:cytochrome c-type biogenesis protein CcmH/NrfG